MLKTAPFLFSLLLCTSLILSRTAQAQTKSIKATIVGETPYVYAQPDFDSEVIAELKVGEVFEISRGKKEGFHKIRVRAGVVGWIADSEVRSGEVSKEKVDSTLSDVEQKRIDKFRKSHRIPIEYTRYRGVSVEQLSYKDSVLGHSVSSQYLVFGLRYAGPGTLFSGLLNTDASLQFSFKAPEYYQSVTSNSAQGFFILGQFQFLNYFNQTQDAAFFYGFGPVIRYTDFVGKQGVGATQTSFTDTELGYGLVFNLGAVVRWSEWGIRVDTKYYWEKNKYFSVGLALQNAF